jgi:hypothetical protein
VRANSTFTTRPDAKRLTAKPRMKKCENEACGIQFAKQRMGQRACGPICAMACIRQDKAKAARKEDEERLLDLKPLNYWAKRAEKACNAYIRARDAGDPCISCGTYDAPEWHAGHCYTVAARPDIRFNEDNIHLQCPKCNTYQGGMVGAYKIRVASKIGQPAP